MKKKDIDYKINNEWTLSEYLTWLNRERDDLQLVDDLTHWAEYGITTAPELADYLDHTCAENMI